MLKSKFIPNNNGGHIQHFYYKPNKDYQKYVHFNSVGQGVMGTPKHHVELPEGTHEVVASFGDKLNGVQKMINFIDMTSNNLPSIGR